MELDLFKKLSKLKCVAGSWAKIAEKNCKQTEKLSAKSVEQAVKNVTEEEERSRNYIVYGLEEAEDGRTEGLTDMSTTLFE